MLELKNICFSADGKQILKDINLRIDDAKFIVITGPNGSGKSHSGKNHQRDSDPRQRSDSP